MPDINGQVILASRVSYSDDGFPAACAFVRRHSRSMRRIHALENEEHGAGDDKSRGSAVALARLLVRAPRLGVRLSDSPAGEEIYTHLSARARGVLVNRIAQGVLVLPGRSEDYLRGRSRQAVRTNLHRGQAAGVTCRAIVDLRARGRIARALGLGDFADKLESHPSDPVWVAYDSTGETLGLLWATVDSEWAMLRQLVASPSEARYALHMTLVDYLCARDVRHLFAEAPGALFLKPGLQYFQHLLGYQVAHLKVQRQSRVRSLGAPRRGRNASAAPVLKGSSQMLPEVEPSAAPSRIPG